MSDDEADVAPGPSRRNVTAAPAQPTDALVQMEHVSDKFKLLQCSTKFGKDRDQALLQRWCFALPAKNPSLQFQLFLDLVAWLMTEITGDASTFRVDKFDDPNTSVNKMMLALRKLDFGLDFPTSKLKAAHGDAAVGVLDFLTDMAVEKNFRWVGPSYGGENDDEADVDAEADVGAIDDEIDEEPEEEEEAIFKEATLVGGREEDADYKDQHQILRSEIDPIVWLTELERVGPRLRVKGAAGGKEWRAHIDATKHNEGAIRNALPSTEKRLKLISDRILEAKDKINLKENYINKQFETKKESFATLKDELTESESRFATSTEQVNKLTSEFSAIAEQLDEMKGTMADRGNSMTDTSPLVQIKQALKSIKVEVTTFDLQIGVVGHTLMQHKLRHGNPKPNAKGFKLSKGGDDDNTEFDDDSDMGESL